MKSLKIQFYLEINHSKDHHRLFARVTRDGNQKKIYSDFLVPEACWLKKENRTIVRSNSSQFIDKPRYYSKSAQANKWIDWIMAKADDVNEQLRTGEEIPFDLIVSYLKSETEDLTVDPESELTVHQFLDQSFAEHQRVKKAAGKPLAPNTLRTYTFYVGKYKMMVDEKFPMVKFDQKEVDRITAALIDDPSWCATSIRSMYGPIKVILRRGIEAGLMPVSYKVPKIPFIPDSPYKLKTRVTIDQLEKIRNYETQSKIKAQAKDAFLLAFFGCGMRMSEVVLLRMKYINPQMKQFQYLAKKTKKMSGWYQMSDRFWEVAKKYYNPKADPETFLLPIMRKYSQYQWPVDDEILDLKMRDARNYFNKCYKDISKHLGFGEVFSTHSARKSFALYLYETTGDIFAVKEFLGHAKIEVTISYLARNGVKTIRKPGELGDIFDKFYEQDKKKLGGSDDNIRKIG